MQAQVMINRFLQRTAMLLTAAALAVPASAADRQPGYEVAEAWSQQYPNVAYDRAFWDTLDWHDEVTSALSADSDDGQPLELDPTGPDSTSSASPEVTLSGSVMDVSSLRLARHGQSTERYVAARVSPGGDALPVVVVCGRAALFQSGTLRAGSTVRALGNRGGVAERPVLIASQLWIDGRSVDANPKPGAGSQ